MTRFLYHCSEYPRMQSPSHNTKILLYSISSICSCSIVFRRTYEYPDDLNTSDSGRHVSDWYVFSTDALFVFIFIVHGINQMQEDFCKIARGIFSILHAS